ncbi:MAG: zinc-ribbon and DUF3426 domain-containing protein [Steroidobacteraceae bacterium]
MRPEVPREIYSLFTQCSKCETIFQLSADVLRAAGGQVRCGRCGEVFNALARLAEQPGAFTVGESPLELETRADRILQSPPQRPEAAAQPPIEFDELDTANVEIAHLEVQGLPDEAATEDDVSLEFTLPPGELDRIFVENKRKGSAKTPLRALPDAAAQSQVIGLEISENARRELLGGAAPDAADANADALDALIAESAIAEVILTEAPPARRPIWIWVSAAVLLALILAAQVVHRNREWLAANAPLGGMLRTIYAQLGSPLPAPANLAAYQLRQWGVTGDPDANGALHVRASIMNTAAEFQPYPLLRVTLADRFGNRIGTRDFEAAEYLGKPNVKLLAPGERVDATVNILDPGTNAEGFEIDVCLRGADRQIACASDAAPHTK